MDLLCQTCGADPRGSWGSNVPRGNVAEGTCPACGRSLTPPFNRPTLTHDDPAVEYEFEDWDPEDRAVAADALTARVVPFRWEPGLILAVAAHREAEADAIFDELEEEATEVTLTLEEPTTGEPSPPPETEDEWSPGEEDLAEDQDDWGQGEDAFAALGDLFDAADRLFHTPTGTVAANDLRQAGAVVRAAPPPYAFDGQLWRMAGEMAGQLETLLTEGSTDDVRSRAETLRNMLAEHV